MKFFISLGMATVSLLLTTAALAQQRATAVPADTCYVEWENDVRVSLASLCRESERSDRPASSRATESPHATAEARLPAVAVEVVSNVGSAVYVNGVLVSSPNRARSYRVLGPYVDSATHSHYSTTIRPTTSRNRRYVQYQRFYPYPQPIQLETP